MSTEHDTQAAELAAYLGEATVKTKALGAGLLANGINVEARTADFLLSAYTVDRDGEVLVPEGCKSDDYQVNPVVLLNHDRDRPIGHVVPWLATKFLDVRAGDGVYGRIYFDETADGEDAWKMVQSGTLRASSPGFRPLTISKEKALPGQTGVTVTSWDLVEWSIVTVPCNPEAVRKSEASGVRSKTLRELFPDAYAALDREEHNRARFEADCARAKSALVGAANYLRSQTKGCVTAAEKAYTINVAVRDSVLTEALTAAFELGRVTGVQFIPDEWLEQQLQEDVDNDNDDWFARNEDGTVRRMPGLGADDSTEVDDEGAAAYAMRAAKVQARPRGPQTHTKTTQPASDGSLTSDALGAVLGTLREATEAIKAIPAARDAAITEHLVQLRRARIGN